MVVVDAVVVDEPAEVAVSPSVVQACPGFDVVEPWSIVESEVEATGGFDDDGTVVAVEPTTMSAAGSPDPGPHPAASRANETTSHRATVPA